MSYLRISLLFLYIISINVVNASALPSGYIKPVGIATKEAAVALNNVQTGLQRFGLSLKIYDAYRPQRAIDHFVRWAKDLTDVRKQTASPYSNLKLCRDHF